ncbi:MAG: NBR1-Ig-like domain-containing protein, partial [Anaerolineales bacterium]|nr:NBR1-Ig-like domain-containing protein [Anaerolineales bacterium]
NTGTAAAQPQFTQTALPVPTSILPTVTPFVVAPPSGGGGGGGGSGGAAATKEQLSCSVISQVPGDGTHFKAGKEFDVVWVVKNNGTKKWESAWVFSFFDGTNFSTTGAYALGRDVKPGDTYQFDLDVIAPQGGGADQPKVITMQWALRGQGARFCRPYVAIFVP